MIAFLLWKDEAALWDLLPATWTKYLLICLNYVFFMDYKEVAGPSLTAWEELIKTT